MNASGLVNIVVALVLAPLLYGVINRVKACFAGRRGQPLLQLYFDLSRLLRKGVVYSRTTTWVFRAGPIVSLAAAVTVLAVIPLGRLSPLATFPGDFVLLAYLLGLARFMTMVAALDTGSSFEGMGASREAFFSTLAEPVLLLSFAVLARLAGSLDLDSMVGHVQTGIWMKHVPEMVLVSAAIFVVLLAENARIPVDDPNTHLELTMIHEVMVLDHSGPEFAFIQYGASLKLWVFCLLLSAMVPLRTGSEVWDTAISVAGVIAVAAGVGVVESTMARLRMVRVPHLLLGAGAFAGMAFVLALR